MAVLSDASQVMSAQPTPDQSAVTAPPVSGPPTTTGGAVNNAQQAVSTVQQSPASQTSATPNPPATTPAQQQDSAHHELLGRAVKSIVQSVQGVDYQPDQHGNVRAVPAAPGSFFRRLVAGMLIGAAAGSQRAPVGREGESGPQNFSSGFGSGASASMGAFQDWDQQKYNRARQQVKDSQEQQRIDDDSTMHAASVAHLNVETANLLHNLHSADQDLIDKHNRSVRAYEQVLTGNLGGIPAKLSVSGKLVDSVPANEFAKAYIQNPNLAHAAPGYQRHFIDESSAGELNWDGESWRDDSGNAVSPSSMIRAYDVPTSTLKSYNSMPGKLINQLAGAQVVDPDKSYSVSGEAAIALYHTGLQADATKARTQAQQTRAANADRQNAANQRKIADVESKRSAAFAKSDSNYQRALSLGADSTEAAATRDQEKQDAETAYQNSLRALGAANSPTQPKNQTQRVTPPNGKSTVFDPQGTPHFVDSDKVNAFLSDPQYRGWHQ